MPRSKDTKYYPVLLEWDGTTINVYPDKPELSRRIESGGIRGVRKDQYAMIGVTAGTVVLPPLEVPWDGRDLRSHSARRRFFG